ncbi:hypothetical protein PIB30_017805 [Stylosanthes scabra]|uniref:Uncharacterized protein n=1 Tax=Stylosanthes scabra TaxID=79078 RepID=A0ABU6U8R1_9FABA|nr:hypothetical protein [Stylosanthes scabra]
MGPNCCSYADKGATLVIKLLPSHASTRHSADAVVSRPLLMALMGDGDMVMLFDIGGRFREIMEVGYRFLSPQPNKRPLWHASAFSSSSSSSSFLVVKLKQNDIIPVHVGHLPHGDLTMEI